MNGALKGAYLVIIGALISFSCKSQNINLENIIEKAYAKEADLYVVKGKEINYLIPPFIGFITKKVPQKKHSFSLIYHSSHNEFEKHLKQVKEIIMLNIHYNKIVSDSMEVTLEMQSTNQEQYLGPHKVLVFIDKRKVLLIYNKFKKQWEYSSLIKLYEEPVAGQN